MTELRDRFRALDDLDVPDVMARARRMGPKPPEPDAPPPRRRVEALVFAVVVTIAAAIAISRALDEQPRPGVQPPPTPTGTALRGDGEVITYTGDDPRESGDLVAQDPHTGEIHPLVDAHTPTSPFTGRLIGSAAWSADGRWAAFEITACAGGDTSPTGTGGLWVTNGLDEPQQLTKPCFENPDLGSSVERWAWSPVGAQLAVARSSSHGDTLVLIDPATGDRTDLGDTVDDVSSLAWSPDGTRIAYGTSRGSVYSVSVDGGDHLLLASFHGYVAGGVFGSGAGITWSPDGSHIAVQAGHIRDTRPVDALYVMNADGSDLHRLADDLQIQSVYWGPNLSWSPDGTGMAYVTFSGGRMTQQMQIWVGSPDGSSPSLLFESAPRRELPDRGPGLVARRRTHRLRVLHARRGGGLAGRERRWNRRRPPARRAPVLEPARRLVLLRVLRLGEGGHDQDRCDRLFRTLDRDRSDGGSARRLRRHPRPWLDAHGAQLEGGHGHDRPEPAAVPEREGRGLPRVPAGGPPGARRHLAPGDPRRCGGAQARSAGSRPRSSSPARGAGREPPASTTKGTP